MMTITIATACLLLLVALPSPASADPARGGCVQVSELEYFCVLYDDCAGFEYNVTNGQSSRGFSKGLCFRDGNVYYCEGQRVVEDVSHARVEPGDVEQPGARDVGDAVHGARWESAQHVERGLHVDARGLQQRLADRAAVGHPVLIAFSRALHRLAHERVAVRVDAAGRDAQKEVAGPDGGARDDAVLPREGEHRAREIEALHEP